MKSHLCKRHPHPPHARHPHPCTHAGTKITIKGAGLVNPTVFIGRAACNVIDGESDSESLVCVTTPATEAKTHRVTVRVNAVYTARCREARTLPCGYVGGAVPTQAWHTSGVATCVPGTLRMPLLAAAAAAAAR